MYIFSLKIKLMAKGLCKFKATTKSGACQNALTHTCTDI